VVLVRHVGDSFGTRVDQRNVLAAANGEHVVLVARCNANQVDLVEERTRDLQDSGGGSGTTAISEKVRTSKETDWNIVPRSCSRCPRA